MSNKGDFPRTRGTQSPWRAHRDKLTDRERSLIWNAILRGEPMPPAEHDWAKAMAGGEPPWRTRNREPSEIEKTCVTYMNEMDAITQEKQKKQQAELAEWRERDLEAKHLEESRMKKRRRQAEAVAAKAQKEIEDERKRRAELDAKISEDFQDTSKWLRHQTEARRRIAQRKSAIGGHELWAIPGDEWIDQMTASLPGTQFWPDADAKY